MFEALKKLWPSGKPQEDNPLAIPDVPSDYWKLEQFKYVPLFVCDELMSFGKYHDFVYEFARDDKPTHPSVYTSQKFNFFFKDLGDGHSYPYALPEDFKVTDAWLRAEQPPARIRGELWHVRPQAFISLDIHKDVGVQFSRQRIRITYPTTPIAWSKGRPIPRVLPDEVRTLEAWTYIGIPEYWRDQIGGIFQNQMQLYTHTSPKTWIDYHYKNDL